ncbi:MAG: ABC transporter permease [Gammaproteobacteria bacterium]|nr:ABC transporter permease [Gammaproteobacteria bacterium]|tara:strand:+ start:7268 stop:7957 length:690 start_codon:yes stop_codon:yes gene_type:complete
MEDLNTSFSNALILIFQLDSNYIEIIALSLQVSLSAVFISCLISMPLAALLSIKNFSGKSIILIILNAFMALPPVVVGLFLYILLSAKGILSIYELLYTPIAMLIAQIIIVTPIITSLSKESIDIYYVQYKDYLRSLNASYYNTATTLLWESRYILTINTLAGLGRALAEVGAVMIVGGNIAHLTRVMTTSIVLETSRGDLSLALSLGVTLIFISIGINSLVYLIKKSN